MADDIKRLHYFTGELLVEKDFTDEQAYHMAMRRRHNRLCHGFGVVDGLGVSKTADREVLIKAGTAIDAQGREVVLVSDVTYPITRTSANRYLTISYHDDFKEADRSVQDGVNDFTRITEAPLLQDSADPPPNDGSVILLARIALTDTGTVNTIDRSTVPVAAVSSIARGAIGPSQLATNSVTPEAIAAGAVIVGKLANSSVTPDAIAAGAVIVGKLANSSVTPDAIAAGAVVVGKLANNSVTPDAIAAGAVIQGKLANNSVTRDAIAAGAINSSKIAQGEIGFGLFTATSNSAGTWSMDPGVTTVELPSPAVLIDAAAPQIVLISVIATSGKVSWAPRVTTAAGNKAAYTVVITRDGSSGPAIGGSYKMITVAMPTG